MGGHCDYCTGIYCNGIAVNCGFGGRPGVACGNGRKGKNGVPDDWDSGDFIFPYYRVLDEPDYGDRCGTDLIFRVRLLYSEPGFAEGEVA